MNITNHNVRNIILHYHIFKNAGTTIEWTLKKNFSKNAISIDDLKNPGTIISNEFLMELIKKNPKFRAISSHQIRLPVPIFSETHFHSIIFLRHPIDRLFSVYEFKKRIKNDSLSTPKRNPLEFAKWAMKNHYMVTENYQTNFLSYNSSKQFEIDLQKATEQMKKCSVLGVVDRMDESLILAEEVLKKYFKNIDLSYIKQNVSQDRESTLLARLNSLKKILGEKIIDELEESNKEDMMLYNFSIKELDERLEKVDNFEKKLIDFKNRCKKNTLNNFKIKIINLRNKIFSRQINQIDIS